MLCNEHLIARLDRLCDERLMTGLDQSVWENIDHGCGYRPSAFALYSDPW